MVIVQVRCSRFSRPRLQRPALSSRAERSCSSFPCSDYSFLSPILTHTMCYYPLRRCFAWQRRMWPSFLAQSFPSLRASYREPSKQGFASSRRPARPASIGLLRGRSALHVIAGRACSWWRRRIIFLKSALSVAAGVRFPPMMRLGKSVKRQAKASSSASVCSTRPAVAAVDSRWQRRLPTDSQQSLSLDRGALDCWACPIARRACARAGAGAADLPHLRRRRITGQTFALPGRTLAEGLAFLSAGFERRGQSASASSSCPGIQPISTPRARGRRALSIQGLGRAGHSSPTRTRSSPTTRRAVRAAAASAAPFDLTCSLQFARSRWEWAVSPGEGARASPIGTRRRGRGRRSIDLAPHAGGGTWHLEGCGRAELPLARLDRGERPTQSASGLLPVRRLAARGA